MSYGQKIAKNALWLMVATTGQKALAFLTFYVIARFSGVEVTGKYFFSVAVTSVFVVLTDLGLTPVVIREVAADSKRGERLFRQAIRAKLFLIPLAIIVSLVYVLSIQGTREIVIAVALACFVMSSDAVSVLLYGVLRGHRELRYEAKGVFIGQLITAVIAMSAAYAFRGNVYLLIIALLGASLWNVGWSIWNVRRLGMRFRETERSSLIPLFREAFPFALAGIFVKVYSYVDTLLLKQFHSDTAVGEYAVAYKITYALQFLPLTFVAALYPAFSSAYAAEDHDAVRRVFAGSERLMMIVSAPLAAAISAFSPTIISLYGRGYEGAVLPLRVLSWVLIPIFLDFPIGSLLNASHRAGLKTSAMGVAMVVNVLMNSALVPRFGPIGAASSGLVSFSILLLVGLWWIRNDLPSYGWLISLLARGGVVSTVLWFGIVYGVDRIAWPYVLLIAIGSTPVLLLVSGLLKREDYVMVRSWCRKKPPLSSV